MTAWQRKDQPTVPTLDAAASRAHKILDGGEKGWILTVRNSSV